MGIFSDVFNRLSRYRWIMNLTKGVMFAIFTPFSRLKKVIWEGCDIDALRGLNLIIEFSAWVHIRGF